MIQVWHESKHMHTVGTDTVNDLIGSKYVVCAGRELLYWYRQATHSSICVFGSIAVCRLCT